MLAIFIAIFLLIYIFAGLAAFIMSLLCFGYSGSTGEKFIGFIISFLVGPFYWLYYWSNTNYCR